MSVLRGLFSQKAQPLVVNLAIWGPPQSGKTTLLAMINTLCKSHDWTFLPAKKETSDYIESVTEYIFEKGQPVPPTEELTPIIHRFTLRDENRRNRQYTLEMPDAAGEIFADPESKLFNMVEYLSICHGIVWLLDPVALKHATLYRYAGGAKTRSYRQMIYQTLSRIYQTRYINSGKVDIYMAFVLTKMDHPDHFRHFDRPRDYALDLLGPVVEKTIEDFCIPVSALGFADSEQKISNLDDSDPSESRLRTKHIVPLDILDPFDWLLKKIL